LFVVEGKDSEPQLAPGRAEPGDELIHRSIAQVERLLHRLEIGTNVPSQDSGDTPRNGAAPTRAAASQDEAAPDAAMNASHDEQAGLVSAVVQAEALRVVLNAHDEADRNRAEAARLRAQAADEADQLLSQAKAARTALVTAQDAAVKLRKDALDEAEQILETARRRAAEQRADAESKARERLAAAERDADQVRQAAWKLAQAEADRHVREHVRTGGDAETLATALQDLEQASTRLEQLSEDVKSKLASITSTTDRFDTLLRIAMDTAGAANGHAPEWVVQARVAANGTSHVRPNGAPEVPARLPPPSSTPVGALQLECAGPPADHSNGHGTAAPNGGEKARRPLGPFFRGERQ
jgi:hypothetical protein